MIFIIQPGRRPGTVLFIDSNAKYYHKNVREMGSENTENNAIG